MKYKHNFCFSFYVYVVVQFYPWFNFDFPLIDIHYPLPSIEKNKGKSRLQLKPFPVIGGCTPPIYKQLLDGNSLQKCAPN